MPGLDAAAGALAETGLGGGHELGMVETRSHEEPHLLRGDVLSGHFGPRLGRRGADPARTRRNPRTRRLTRVAGLAGLQPGFARPAACQTGHPSCR